MKLPIPSRLLLVALMAPACASLEPRDLTESEAAAVDLVIDKACELGAGEGKAKIKAFLSEHPEYIPGVVGLSSLMVTL